MCGGSSVDAQRPTLSRAPAFTTTTATARSRAPPSSPQQQLSPQTATLAALATAHLFPRNARNARAAAGRRGEVDPERLWATLLVCNALEVLEFSWLADEDQNLTIVDLGNLWVKKQAR